jgi:site-specific DNA recombinase
MTGQDGQGQRAVIFARVSTDMERDNYSIPSQVAACVDYDRECGYVVIGEQHVDRATGQSANGSGGIPACVDDYKSRELSRPALDAAIDYLETVGYDAVIVYSLDRLAREPYVRQMLETKIARLGGRIHYIQGDYDDSPEGEVQKDLEATFGKWENAKRVERCLCGKRTKAQQGLFVAGRPPFGYDIEPDAFGGLAAIEEQATVVRRIFALYVDDGLSIREIARRLSDEAVPNWSGKTTWNKSSVARILKNPIYGGCGYYNKKKRTRQNGLARRDRSEWIAYEMTPIVDEARYQAAQQRLAHNKARVRRGPARFYLLSGLISCTSCHRPYPAQTNKQTLKDGTWTERVAYRHRKRTGHCCNRWI